MTILQIKGYDVMIDTEDAQRVQEKKWYVNRQMAKINGRYYFYHDECKNKERNAVLLHRFIMGCKKGDGIVIDHINGNTLDCRKENLRMCTMKQNMQNSKGMNSLSGYKGVHWLPQVQKWQVRISLDNVTHYFGMYSDPLEAAQVYDMAALYYFKEYARTNFNRGQYINIDLQEKLSAFAPSFSSIYRGVCYSKKSNKWVACITKNKKINYLGSYNNAEEAAIAYNKKAIELHGDKAKLNIFIQEEPV